MLTHILFAVVLTAAALAGPTYLTVRRTDHRAEGERGQISRLMIECNFFMIICLIATWAFLLPIPRDYAASICNGAWTSYIVLFACYAWLAFKLSSCQAPAPVAE